MEMRVVLMAGLVLGILGERLLSPPGPWGLNLFLWAGAVALGALTLHGRTGVELDRERAAWLGISVLFAAGFAWRDAEPLKVLALGCVTVAFALGAYRLSAAWVRGAGVTRYARAWGTGALHAWTAAALVLLDARRELGPDAGSSPAWQRAAGMGRGLAIAAPFILLFGALFMSADAVFANMVTAVVRVDVEWAAEHVMFAAILTWLSTGYLRGFLTGTELPPLGAFWRQGTPVALAQRRPALSITEVGTALAAIDLLFLVFVLVQFRYLFGGDALVQVTPGLTYADYARRGFFELVLAVALVVPLLLAADWVLDRRARRDTVVFRALAGLQITLVLAITASALQRLRLYYDSYGLTDSRFYAMVLLFWIGAMLVWLAATVLRGRREDFAFGALASGLVTIALLFVVNPDAIIARTNVARLTAGSADRTVQFDVAYATRLSADAVPILIEALPALPGDAQCTLARHMLRRWAIPFSTAGERDWRTWNWSAVNASDAVRANEARLLAMVGPNQECAAR